MTDTTQVVSTKPLGGRAYGSIPHLPGSRRGPADRGVNEGQARICLERTRDRHDVIIVQEKLDGSNVAAAKVNGQVLALVRAGHLATTSRFEQHQLWAWYVRRHYEAFDELLQEGERVCGEWLAQAHGTRYDLSGLSPFVAFDLMRDTERLPYGEFVMRMRGMFGLPRLIHRAASSFSIAQALEAIKTSDHGALDPVEGAVWRVERRGVVDFLAKYVRAEKVDGIYLPEMSGGDAVWNWRPGMDA